MHGAFLYRPVSISLSLACNFIATALTAGKAWRVALPRSITRIFRLTVRDRRYRSSLRSHLEAGTRASRVEMVAILVVESGLAYTLLWVCHLLMLVGFLNLTKR